MNTNNQYNGKPLAALIQKKKMRERKITTKGGETFKIVIDFINLKI